jgi:hypothetical protein
MDPTEKVSHFITTEAEGLFFLTRNSHVKRPGCVSITTSLCLVQHIEQNYFLFKLILGYKIPTYGTQTPQCNRLI